MAASINFYNLEFEYDGKYLELFIINIGITLIKLERCHITSLIEKFGSTQTNYAIL